jgi:alpha-glucoside transport system permease protein
MTEATLESAEARREPRTMSERIVRFLGRTPIHLALGFIALIWLLPSVGLLITSFRPRADIQVSGWWEILGNLRLTLDNYSQVLQGQGMLPAFLNSVYITVPSTILPLLIASLAAFGFAWVRFPFRDTLFLIVIGLMMVPIQLALIPILELFANFQLNRSFVGIWLAHTAFSLPFGIFLLRNFFITLPRDLIEAARIDGASSVNIVRHLPVPVGLERPAHGARLRAVGRQADDRAGDATARHVRLRVAHPGRQLLPSDARAADRVLQPAALLRAGAPGRLGEVSGA